MADDTSSYRISRNCLTLLLIAQVAVLLPHVARLPVWITLVCITATVWRVALHHGRGVYPSRWVRGMMVVVGAAGIFFSYDTWFAVEPVVAMLVLSFALKLIEVSNRRDVMVVIFLAYTVAGSAFLFNERLAISLYMIVAVLFNTAALVALHQNESTTTANGAISRPLLAAGKLLGQAAPLMLILFVSFPRIEPLWGVPDTAARPQTGPSDSMSPGDISDLAQSSRLAFRVSFDADIPDTRTLYWRGLVLNDFDGRRWSQNPANRSQSIDDTGRVVTSGDAIRYTVLMEPSQRSWLYAIAAMRSTSPGVINAANATLRHRGKMRQKFSYDITSWPEYRLQPDLSPKQRAIETALPTRGNPKTRRLAQQLVQASNNTQDLVGRLLRHFNEEQFFYTLSPGKLGNDSIDEFLFETRRGFCEHFAGALVYLLRAADIPARVVVGYQGGEVNEYDDYLLVHEYDAHAWAEVWIAGEGWKRVDPTAAVAPNRVEHGMREIWQNERQSQRGPLASIWNLRSLPGLHWARMQWDSVNYAWSKSVVNYDSGKRFSLLKNWLGEITPLRMFAFIFGAAAVVFALVALVLLRKRPQRDLDPLDRLYVRHERALSRLGFDRGNGEPAIAFARRIASSAPALGPAAQAIAMQYSILRYAAPETSSVVAPKFQNASEFDNFRDAVNAFTKLCQREARTPERGILSNA